MIVSLCLVLLEILIVNGGVSYLPSSTLSYKEIENKIRSGISKATLTPDEEKLIEIAVQERCDHQKTKYDLEAAKNETKYEHDRAVIAVQDKEFESKFRWVLVVRTRLETLENGLFPIDMHKPNSRFLCWKIITGLDHPAAKQIKAKVLSEYNSVPQYKLLSDDEKLNLFAAALQKIYGDLCTPQEAPVYNAKDDTVLSRFTKQQLTKEEEDELRQFMRILGVDYDPQFLKALQAIAEPVPLLGYRKSVADAKSSFDVNELLCVTIYTLENNGKFKGKVTTESVHEFFPTVDENKMVVTIKSGDKGMKDSVVIKFPDINTALTAFDEHLQYLKKSRVHVNLDKCNT